MAIRKLDASYSGARKSVALKSDPTRVDPLKLKLGKLAVRHDPRTLMLASYVTAALPTLPDALLAPRAFAQPPIKRVGGPRLKVSLNAYSFNKTLNDHLKGRGKGMTLFDLLDFSIHLCQ